MVRMKIQSTLISNYELPYGGHCLANSGEYIGTTAGYKNTFAYSKLIQLLVRQIINPDEAMVLGGTYKIPVMEGLLSKTFVKQLQLDDTYNEASFARQYESYWYGDADNAFFSSDVIDRNRVLLQPEYEYSGRSTRTAYYVIGVDVGRRGCTTQACAFKVTPQTMGASIKSLVNIQTWDEQHFEDQAINIKRMFYKYKARRVVIDGNGLGIGLVDYMVKSQVDPETGDALPPFGVYNDEDGFYKKFKTPQTEVDAMYIIKANAPINTQAHTYVQTQMAANKIKFLIDQNQAKVKLMGTKLGQTMSIDKRNDYLKPFVQTSILKEQMLNLIEQNQGVNIILKQASRGVKKDKFSAFEYGMYYIKQEQDRNRKSKKRDISAMMFFS